MRDGSEVHLDKFLLPKCNQFKYLSYIIQKNGGLNKNVTYRINT